eukprot:SAG31_NODE_4327_length_3353_cov_4.742778_8_plen_110_part_00
MSAAPTAKKGANGGCGARAGRREVEDEWHHGLQAAIRAVPAAVRRRPAGLIIQVCVNSFKVLGPLLVINKPVGSLPQASATHTAASNHANRSWVQHGLASPPTRRNCRH